MSNALIDPTHNSRPSSAGSDVVQAGFLKRWAALFLDQLILSGVFYAFFFAIILIVGFTAGFDAFESSDTDEPPPWAIAMMLIVFAAYLIGIALYYALMESSRHQATIGKIAMGIKVVDQQGRRLTFSHALARWFAAGLSYLTLYIGFLMVAFTQKKQGLHDLVAGTFVVDKWAYTEFPERQRRGVSGCFIAIAVVFVVLFLVSIIAIIAAIAIPAYQQYTTRAQFAQLDAPLTNLRAQVETYYESTGRCPDNSSDGFGAAETYADSLVSRIVVAEFEAGFCGISVWMPPVRGSIERQFLVEFDPDDTVWYCTNKAGLSPLPDWCE